MSTTIPQDLTSAEKTELYRQILNSPRRETEESSYDSDSVTNEVFHDVFPRAREGVESPLKRRKLETPIPSTSCHCTNTPPLDYLGRIEGLAESKPSSSSVDCSSLRDSSGLLSICCPSSSYYPPKNLSSSSSDSFLKRKQGERSLENSLSLTQSEGSSYTESPPESPEKATPQTTSKVFPNVGRKLIFDVVPSSASDDVLSSSSDEEVTEVQ